MFLVADVAGEGEFVAARVVVAPGPGDLAAFEEVGQVARVGAIDAGFVETDGESWRAQGW